MDRTGLFVLTSRVNRPDKMCSNRPVAAPAEFPAAPPDAIDSMNLTPASIKPAAAFSMPSPRGATPDAARALPSSGAAVCGAAAAVDFGGITSGDTASIDGLGL